jgi:hypothetical protein
VRSGKLRCPPQFEACRSLQWSRGGTYRFFPAGAGDHFDGFGQNSRGPARGVGAPKVPRKYGGRWCAGSGWEVSPPPGREVFPPPRAGRILKYGKACGTAAASGGESTERAGDWGERREDLQGRPAAGDEVWLPARRARTEAPSPRSQSEGGHSYPPARTAASRR